MSSSGSRPRLVLTGYGPFAGHDRNTSWQAVKVVKEKLWNNPKVELVAQEIPVDYDFVQKNVPGVWTETDGGDVIAIVHVGVSGIASKITVETQAHNSGYYRKDVRGKCPEGEKCSSDASDSCEVMTTAFDVDRLVESVNCCTDLGLSRVEATPSTDAGRYLCEFVMYKSLSSFRGRRAIFIHVPDATAKNKCDYTEEQCGAAVKVILDAILTQLQETDKTEYL